MGAHNSKIRVDQTVINETVMQMMVKNENIQTTNVNVFQKMNLENVSIQNCAFEITQSADVSVKAVSQFSQAMTEELISKLEQEVDNQIDNKMKPETEFLAPPQITTTKSDLKSTVKNIIKNQVTVENINKNITNVNSLQEQDIKNLRIDKCPGYQATMAIVAANTKLKDSTVAEFRKSCDTSKVCKITQDIKMDVVAEQITESIVKAITNDEKVQDLSNKLENDVAPKAVGISAFVPFMGIGCFGCCCCFLILAVALYFIWNSDTTKQAIVVGGNVAAKKM